MYKHSQSRVTNALNELIEAIREEDGCCEKHHENRVEIFTEQPCGLVRSRSEVWNYPVILKVNGHEVFRSHKHRE